MLHLKASLRRAQRRMPEALALLDQALAVDRWGETPSLLISKAKAVEELGEFEQAIVLLRQAALLIDAHRDPSNWLFVQMNLAGNLCHLGRFEQAALLLPEVAAQAEKLGNKIDLLRVAWQRGKVAAGQGRADDAVGILEQVRGDFAELGNAYDTALVAAGRCVGTVLTPRRPARLHARSGALAAGCAALTSYPPKGTTHCPPGQVDGELIDGQVANQVRCVRRLVGERRNSYSPIGLLGGW
jgi:tetratricopeptide (TPR) repeat protein